MEQKTGETGRLLGAGGIRPRSFTQRGQSFVFSFPSPAWAVPEAFLAGPGVSSSPRGAQNSEHLAARE